MAELSMTRRLDAPPVIVWDALVDPVLVEGWLDPEIRLVDSSADDAVSVREERPPNLLEVESGRIGRLRIELAEVEGGARGRSTVITLSLASAPTGGADAARSGAERIALWSTRLDQLADLLHGDPVDWDHWQRDRGADYAAYLAEARAGRPTG